MNRMGLCSAGLERKGRVEIVQGWVQRSFSRGAKQKNKGLNKIKSAKTSNNFN